jgi:DDE superfamily endonuclease
MYVHKKDMPEIHPKHRPAFRNKRELAVELLPWAKAWMGLLGKPLYVVADGAYAKANLLKPAKSLGTTVVSGLRCNAVL